MLILDPDFFLSRIQAQKHRITDPQHCLKEVLLSVAQLFLLENPYCGCEGEKNKSFFIGFCALLSQIGFPKCT
jgi:hypothetical protein